MIYRTKNNLCVLSALQNLVILFCKKMYISIEQSGFCYDINIGLDFYSDIKNTCSSLNLISQRMTSSLTWILF